LEDLNKLTLSIVIPHYKSSKIVDLIYEILKSTLDFFSVEIIIVNDDPDSTNGNIIETLCHKNSQIKYIELTKNFGQHNAILAGISFATNDLIVTIDDDLQNPPNEILKIVEHLSKYNFDLVYGTPCRKKHNILKRLSSKLIRIFLSKILRVKNVNNISSFRVFKRNILKLESLKITEVSIDSLLNWSTSRIGHIKVEHNSRGDGQSGYNFRKLMVLALNTVISYSVIPLKIATYFGLFVFVTGAILFCFYIGRYLLFDVNIPGFTTIASLIIMFSGTQIIILGVMGEYLARLHFNVMNKPPFVVRKTLGFR
jgi:glycosyltransferase involved in cell wall biosynthesis